MFICQYDNVLLNRQSEQLAPILINTNHQKMKISNCLLGMISRLVVAREIWNLKPKLQTTKVNTPLVNQSKRAYAYWPSILCLMGHSSDAK